MKLTAFSIGVSKTINMGNYQSVRIEASVTVDVPASGEGDWRSLKSAAQDELKQLFVETHRAQMKDKP